MAASAMPVDTLPVCATDRAERLVEPFEPNASIALLGMVRTIAPLAPAHSVG
jgi:hypothetical protein